MPDLVQNRMLAQPFSDGTAMNVAHHANASPVRMEIQTSRGFAGWLAEHQVSLATTTYQSNKLLVIGRGESERISVVERNFDRPMGLWSDGQTMWLASHFQIWRLQKMATAGAAIGAPDGLFVPRIGYVTGELDVHDIAADADGRPVFVNTLFNCLATVSERDSFVPLWRPPFVSRFVAEDHCHLNGLAMENGTPRFVTACSRTDFKGGWRERRVDGGCVVDVTNDEIVVDGLSMPHSPRLHRGRLWLLNAGRGELGWVDTDRGRFNPIGFCPGYARGLALIGKYAIVGLSLPRNENFRGLPLDEELGRRGIDAQCGLLVFNLDTGEEVCSLRIGGGVQELYDVTVLPGVTRPKTFGFKTDEIRRNVWFEDAGKVTHWTAREND